MKQAGLLVAALATSLLAVAASPAPVTPAPSPAATPAPPPSPSPSPTQPASTGQLNLSPASGPPGDSIAISGIRFRPSEAVTIFWDNRDHVLIGATADAQGAFTTRAIAPEDVPGQHAVCALEPNQVCAGYQLQASSAATSAPSPAASLVPPTSAPTPYPTIPLPEPAPTASAGVGALSMLLHSPLILAAVMLLLVLVIASILWIRAGSGGSAPNSMEGATVSHRAQRAGTEAESQGSMPQAPWIRPPPATPTRPAARSQGEGADEPPDLPTAGD